MPRNFTLENFYQDKSQNKNMKNQEVIGPDPKTIQTLLAYSKALSVIKSRFKKGKKQSTFRLILN